MVGLTGGVRSGAARVAGIYLVVSIVWIVLTDIGVLGFVLDPAALTGLQTAKGIFFVTASAGLLYVLVSREQRRLAETNQDLELTLRHASVLHRLLRHNLRNSCDVIMNNVALLRDDRAETEAAYSRIERQTATLVDIAEKSRHLRDLVLADDPEPRPIDLVPVVHHHADGVQEDFPEAVVTVDAPESATALAHPRIGIGIDEVVRNAIIHADRADPTVAITVTTGDERVAIEVADDGPGLPSMELSALEGSFEEPLEHSRGIGLWLVQFLIAKSDASLSTRPNDPTGTIVRMTFEREP